MFCHTNRFTLIGNVFLGRYLAVKLNSVETLCSKKIQVLKCTILGSRNTVSSCKICSVIFYSLYFYFTKAAGLSGVILFCISRTIMKMTTGLWRITRDLVEARAIQSINNFLYSWFVTFLVIFLFCVTNNVYIAQQFSVHRSNFHLAKKPKDNTF